MKKLFALASVLIVAACVFAQNVPSSQLLILNSRQNAVPKVCSYSQNVPVLCPSGLSDDGANLTYNGVPVNTPVYLQTAFPGTAGAALAGTKAEVGSYSNPDFTFDGLATYDVGHTTYVINADIQLVPDTGDVLVYFSYTDANNFIAYDPLSQEAISMIGGAEQSHICDGAVDPTNLQISWGGAGTKLSITDTSGGSCVSSILSPGQLPPATSVVGFGPQNSTGDVVKSFKVSGLAANNSPVQYLSAAIDPVGNTCTSADPLMVTGLLDGTWPFTDVCSSDLGVYVPFQQIIYAQTAFNEAAAATELSGTLVTTNVLGSSSLGTTSLPGKWFYDDPGNESWQFQSGTGVKWISSSSSNTHHAVLSPTPGNYVAHMAVSSTHPWSVYWDYFDDSDFASVSISTSGINPFCNVGGESTDCGSGKSANASYVCPCQVTLQVSGDASGTGPFATTEGTNWAMYIVFANGASANLNGTIPSALQLANNAGFGTTGAFSSGNALQVQTFMLANQ
jgi:hypothetical protein